jgi:hypothetical protein
MIGAGGSVSIGITRSSDDARLGDAAAGTAGAGGVATGATGEIPDAGVIGLTTGAGRGVCAPFTARGGSGGALPGGFPIPGSVPALTGAAF